MLKRFEENNFIKIFKNEYFNYYGKQLHQKIQFACNSKFSICVLYTIIYLDSDMAKKYDASYIFFVCIFKNHKIVKSFGFYSGFCFFEFVECPTNSEDIVLQLGDYHYYLNNDIKVPMYSKFIVFIFNQKLISAREYSGVYGGECKVHWVYHIHNKPSRKQMLVENYKDSINKIDPLHSSQEEKTYCLYAHHHGPASGRHWPIVFPAADKHG